VRRRRERSLVWLLAAVVLSAALGCAEEPAGERHVARIPRKSDLAWKLESAVYPLTQKAPWNVMWEVTRYPGAQPTAAQQRRADALVERSLASARRNGWFEYEKGAADGYSTVQDHLGTHYGNNDFLLDDRFLDPERPEFLMYYDSTGGKKLVGYMFVVPLDEEGPQVGGPLTIWHYHLWATPVCIENGRVGVIRAENGRCQRGSPSQKSLEMLHVWFVDHPEGRFASRMRLPQELVERLGEAPKD